jgi:hypothetical protein
MALQEMGEETIGTFDSVTRLQQRIFELSNQKVDIFVNEDKVLVLYKLAQNGESPEKDNPVGKAQTLIWQVA